MYLTDSVQLVNIATHNIADAAAQPRLLLEQLPSMPVPWVSIPPVANVLVRGQVFDTEAAKLMEEEDQQTERVKRGESNQHLRCYRKVFEVIVIIYLIRANDENRHANSQG